MDIEKTAGATRRPDTNSHKFNTNVTTPYRSGFQADADRTDDLPAGFAQTHRIIARHYFGIPSPEDSLATMGVMNRRTNIDHGGIERESESLNCEAIVLARTAHPGGGKKRNTKQHHDAEGDSSPDDGLPESMGSMGGPP